MRLCAKLDFELEGYESQLYIDVKHRDIIDLIRLVDYEKLK